MAALSLLGVLGWLGLLLVAMVGVAFRHMGDVGRLALHPTYSASDEASGVIANGYLRLDTQEWIRAVEKRRAALGR